MMNKPEIESHIEQLHGTMNELSKGLARLEDNLEELRRQLQVGREPAGDTCVPCAPPRDFNNQAVRR